MNFIEVLSVWVGSIILSFAMNISNVLKIVKDLADLGYKINDNKLSKLNKEMEPEYVKYRSMMLFLPIVNVMTVALDRIKYIKSSDLYFNKLDALGSIEEMSDYEKIAYAENPTGLNAIFLQIKMETKLQNALKVNLADKSVIYFDKEDDEIVIYKAEGPFSQLSGIEQKQKITEIYNKFAEEIYLNYEEIEGLMNSLINGKKHINEKKTNDKIEIRINELKQLKKDLLQEKEESENKPLIREKKK